MSYFIILLSALLLSACGGTNQNLNVEDNETKISADTMSEIAMFQDDADILEEAKVDEDIVLDVWKAYLKSEYCDVQTDNIESTLALLDKRSNTVASLELDASNHPYVREKTFDVDEEEFYEETVLETFACYPLKNGGWLSLWYYDASDWGRKIFAVYKFENNVLTRQKNAFPPFESDFIDKNPSFDWDELVKLSGMEVVYFMQDCWPTKFDADGFTMSLGGMEETVYKFNGSGFEKEN
ncbi:MAG: hypothetical protein IK025_00805 [Bacteroidales bacterium]|nr:hypothetical protein [Bacteroidales bacterium]